MTIASVLARLDRVPRARRLVKVLGRPVYDAWLRARGQYVAWRYGWVFPPNVPPGFAIAFATHRWEPDTTSILSRLLSRGDVFIDVGANVGYYTRLAAELVGETGRVYAFEPEPANFEALTRNTRPYPQVQAIPAAVGSRNGVLPLFLSELAGCHSLAVAGERFRWVPTLTLDTFVEAAGLESVHLLKIDAEGGEPDVLAGMRGCIEKGVVRAFVVEYAPQILSAAGGVPESFVAALLSTYDVTVIERGKYRSPAGPLTAESLRELTRRLCSAEEPTACVNLLAVVMNDRRVAPLDVR